MTGSSAPPDDNGKAAPKAPPPARPSAVPEKPSAQQSTAQQLAAQQARTAALSASSKPAAAAANGSATAPAAPVAAVVRRAAVPPSPTQRLADGLGPTAVEPADRGDSKRIVPRSPRTAIEPDPVEMPTRRSAGARHPLVIIGNAVISIFVLLAVVAGVALFIGKQRFEEPGPLPQDRVVNIPHGSGMRDIADVLTREGVIDQPWTFIGGVLVLKAREGLKAGEYKFKAHSSLRDVVATIVDGKVVMHQVSIPEGLTSQQIVARLLADDVLTGDIKEIPPEGSLLPDTYSFARGTTREQMIRHMEQADKNAVEEIWEHRSPELPLKTPEQLVTLASLVEKETGKPSERSQVAAVFVNRLKQNMRLQSDPTIIYGLVGGKGTLGRPIMKSEIGQPTPYNTYVINGLPPGPITNPGRAALEAAANPARTRDLYFVADGSGGHLFAETYEQHEKNVARLRQIETDQQDQVPVDDRMNSQPPTGAAAAATTPAPAADAPPPRATARPRARAAH